MPDVTILGPHRCDRCNLAVRAIAGDRPLDLVCGNRINGERCTGTLRPATYCPDCKPPESA